MGERGNPGVPGGLQYVTDEELSVCWLFQEDKVALNAVVEILKALNKEREIRIKGELDEDKDR